MMLVVLVSTILPTIVDAAGERGGWWRQFKRGPAVQNGYIWDLDGETCAAHLSNGPANANIEIRFGNIAPSTHLHFWAAKESSLPYNVLTNAGGAQVHESPNDAYPQYNASNFNGGNVLVNEAGEAVIRIRAPSTYKHKRDWTGFNAPHVHMRLCGDSQDRALPTDKLVFDMQGVHVKTGCGKGRRQNQNEPYTVLSIRNLTTGEETLINSTTPGQSEMAELKDWDALEFSGTFQCLTQNLFYNQLTSECTQSCPEGTETVRGQCVRPTVSDDKVTLKSTWRMQIECDTWCWKSQKGVAVHNTRLSSADHLDISIQEVKKVRLSRDAENSQTNAYLMIKVHTQRLLEQEGASLLRSFMSNTTRASELFGFAVQSTELILEDGSTTQVPSGDVEAALASSASSTTLPSSIVAEGEDMDEYLEYYNAELEQMPQTGSGEPSQEIAGLAVPDGVPPAAIIGGAVAVVLLLTVAALLAYLKHRTSKAAAASATGNSDKGKEVEETVKSVVVVEDFAIGDDNEDTHNKVINNV